MEAGASDPALVMGFVGRSTRMAGWQVAMAVVIGTTVLAVVQTADLPEGAPAALGTYEPSRSPAEAGRSLAVPDKVDGWQGVRVGD